MKLKFYAIDKDYVNYLKQFDSNVCDIDYGDNRMKGFIGIVFQARDGINYFAPITSYKPKFLKIHDDIDFMKIYDNENKILGALDLNNMVPVPKGAYQEVNNQTIEKFRLFKNSAEKASYIGLLYKELSFLNKRKYKILKNAEKLYHIVKNYPNSRLAQRSCSFEMLESKCIEWIKIRGIDIKPFGKIIKDMYEVAKNSDNFTWFLEPDSFEDGTYTMKDYEELLRDVEVLHDQYGILDIDTIIEVSDYENNNCDTVATFYGEFYSLFANNPEQARQELMERETELDYEMG